MFNYATHNKIRKKVDVSKTWSCGEFIYIPIKTEYGPVQPY